MVADHIEEAKERDRRITNLELQEADRRTKCEPMVMQIAKELHNKTHAEYVASLRDSAFQGKLVWFFASTFGKILLVIVGILAGIMLNLAVYGRP